MATEPVPSYHAPVVRTQGTASYCVLCGLTAFPNLLHYCPAETRIREIIREEIERSRVTVTGES